MKPKTLSLSQEKKLINLAEKFKELSGMFNDQEDALTSGLISKQKEIEDKITELKNTRPNYIFNHSSAFISLFILCACFSMVARGVSNIKEANDPATELLCPNLIAAICFFMPYILHGCIFSKNLASAREKAFLLSNKSEKELIIVYSQLIPKLRNRQQSIEKKLESNEKAMLEKENDLEKLKKSPATKKDTLDDLKKEIEYLSTSADKRKNKLKLLNDQIFVLENQNFLTDDFLINLKTQSPEGVFQKIGIENYSVNSSQPSMPSNNSTLGKKI